MIGSGSAEPLDGKCSCTSSLCKEIVVYSLIGSSGLFLFSTVLLSLVLLFFCVAKYREKKNRKEGTDAIARRKGMATHITDAAAKSMIISSAIDPSYWITDCELDQPRVFSSTPNLSDWSSPRPVRTFVSTPPLDRADINSSRKDRSHIVPSASMAPLVPLQIHGELAIRKSASHSDMTDFPGTNQFRIEQRRSPPSPPVFPQRSSTPSAGEETPKPMPRRKRKKVKKSASPSPALITLDTSVGEAEHSASLDLQYVNMHKLPTAEMSPPMYRLSSPMYQRINTQLRDAPSHYETVELVRRQ